MSYEHPGVYVEEVPSSVRPITAAPTSVAAFVGRTLDGDRDEPILINSFADFEEEFATKDADGKVADENYDEPMWLAMRAFYQNGGGRAYIVNVEATTAAYQAAFDLLKKISEISILVLPGTDRPSQAIRDAAVAHCEDTKNRIYISDPPAGDELETAADVTAAALPAASTYTVCYYPWIWAPDPLGGDPIAVGPSAYAAGMWAKTDGRRGVWKAPAGLEAALIGVSSLRFDVGDEEQDILNPVRVNCIRNLPGAAAVIWGARMLTTEAQWLYVPVRRTAIFIETSIYNSIQWAVFEPNNHILWASLRANIGAFMDTLFRAGAFQGETAQQAYFVRCGLGQTMKQVDIDNGKVIVEVGFAPLKPAEFVIIRIEQKVAEE